MTNHKQPEEIERLLFLIAGRNTHTDVCLYRNEGRCICSGDDLTATIESVRRIPWTRAVSDGEREELAKWCDEIRTAFVEIAAIQERNARTFTVTIEPSALDKFDRIADALRAPPRPAPAGEIERLREALRFVAHGNNGRAAANAALCGRWDEYEQITSAAPRAQERADLIAWCYGQMPGTPASTTDRLNRIIAALRATPQAQDAIEDDCEEDT